MAVQKTPAQRLPEEKQVKFDPAQIDPGNVEIRRKGESREGRPERKFKREGHGSSFSPKGDGLTGSLGQLKNEEWQLVVETESDGARTARILTDDEKNIFLDYRQRLDERVKKAAEDYFGGEASPEFNAGRAERQAAREIAAEDAAKAREDAAKARDVEQKRLDDVQKDRADALKKAEEAKKRAISHARGVDEEGRKIGASYSKAHEEINNALEHLEDLGQFTSMERASLYTMQGDLYRRQGDRARKAGNAGEADEYYRQAGSSYSNALDNDSHSVRALNGRGVSRYRQHGKREEALEDFSKAEKQVQAEIKARQEQVSSMKKAGLDAEGAEERLRKAHASARVTENNKAVVEWQQNKPAAAEGDIDRAAATVQDPVLGGVKCENSTVFKNQAYIKRHLGKTRETEEAARKARETEGSAETRRMKYDTLPLEQAPAAAEEERAREEEWRRLNEKGLELQKAGDHTKALDFFEIASNMQPKNSTLKNNCALAEYELFRQERRKGNAEEAAGHLIKAEFHATAATKMDDRNALAWDVLGCVNAVESIQQEDRGKLETAAQQFNKAITLVETVQWSNFNPEQTREEVLETFNHNLALVNNRLGAVAREARPAAPAVARRGLIGDRETTLEGEVRSVVGAVREGEGQVTGRGATFFWQEQTEDGTVKRYSLSRASGPRAGYQIVDHTTPGIPKNVETGMTAEQAEAKITGVIESGRKYSCFNMSREPPVEGTGWDHMHKFRLDTGITVEGEVARIKALIDRRETMYWLEGGERYEMSLNVDGKYTVAHHPATGEPYDVERNAAGEWVKSEKDRFEIGLEEGEVNGILTHVVENNPYFCQPQYEPDVSPPRKTFAGIGWDNVLTYTEHRYGVE